MGFITFLKHISVFRRSYSYILQCCAIWEWVFTYLKCMMRSGQKESCNGDYWGVQDGVSLRSLGKDSNWMLWWNIERKLSWFGYLERMEESPTFSSCLKFELDGTLASRTTKENIKLQVIIKNCWNQIEHVEVQLS